ncbi:BON domain-containing protein [Caenimonas aquaedulcis]|uniref:BON domain-containing protein n=1 Tax=Caenimonas aquaedulcis TaxID=2793270 RepID=A0A931H1Z4_9BURK|nr:BON domain-containing protein [Caenimonas aquaedulcis]MBG9387014.1 BON domain-containing protein [Caenimonas aquaedulcis]
MTMKKDDTLTLLLSFAAGAAVTWWAGSMLLAPRGTRLVPVSARPADDARLRKDVRARLDELVSHPRAIEVEVHEGEVRVSGQVLSGELDGLLVQLTRVPGVRRVRNALATLSDPSGFGESVSAV